MVSGSAEWETYVNSLADCYAERLSRNMANSFLDDNSSASINERVDKLINDLSKVSVRKNNGYSIFLCKTINKMVFNINYELLIFNSIIY